jgi:hypothetical protein
MSDSTSIASLPTNNVTLTTTEKPVQNSNDVTNIQRQPPSQQSQQQQSSIAELSSKTINDIVSGIQQAAQNGMTSLQSRDIPATTPHLTQDEAIKPNYVPEPKNKDYIEEHDSYQSLIEKNQKNIQHQNKMDSIYDEIQNPLMAMILFFFFQMPYFTKLMKRQLPSLFKDNYPTFSGHLFKASLFGFTFYSITKISNYLSEM